MIRDDKKFRLRLGVKPWSRQIPAAIEGCIRVSDRISTSITSITSITRMTRS